MGDTPAAGIERERDRRVKKKTLCAN